MLFDSSVKKFQLLYGELNAIYNSTHESGKYYIVELKIKTRKIENSSNIKSSNIDYFIPNKYLTNTNIFTDPEIFGFDIKVL